jgi:hypothetical protein
LFFCSHSKQEIFFLFLLGAFAVGHGPNTVFEREREREERERERHVDTNSYYTRDIP